MNILSSRTPENEAPKVVDKLPWSSREDPDLAYAEPPRPLSLSADLSEQHVEQIQSLAAGRKFSFPVMLALVAYFALKFYFGDDLPDVVLYLMLGGTFLLNTLMSLRKDKNHYAKPGRITMTFSADGVEVSAEAWAGHVPWVLVDRFEVSGDAVVVHAASAPRFHAIPLDSLPPEGLLFLQTWLHYAAQRRRRRPGRALLWLALFGLVVFGAYTVWDRLGRPVPQLPLP